MKQSIKGAIAAAAAGVLLLGGAGTIAYWSDSKVIDESTITAGTLSLGTPECGAGWKYATGNVGAGNAVNLIVPGDKISKVCTFTIAATGDNLKANLSIPATTLITPSPTAPTFVATVGAEYTIGGGEEITEITSANSDEVVTATITVDFPFGDKTAINTNDTRNITAKLADIPVTLTQVENKP